MAKKKILIVDDEKDFLGVMSVRIESWGYEVITAENGKDALDAIESQKPDILVLDYKLPDIDGITVLKELREHNQKLPVIFLTAYPNTSTIKEGEGLGINAFIPKLSSYGNMQNALKTAIEITERKMKGEGQI